MESLEVVYENGVLKPTKKLKLKEGEKLRIKIITGNIADFIRRFEGEIEKPKKDPLKMLEDMRE